MNRVQLAYVARSPLNWVGHILSNSWGIWNVFEMAWLRKVPGGVVGAAHPFATGVDARTGGLVWRGNFLFRSRAAEIPFEDDLAIIERVMGFIRSMVTQSAARLEAPHGRPSRMPPAINLLHGPVHYHAVTLLFDDVADVLQHFTDRRFMDEVRRCIREQGREIIVVMRRRDYDRHELAKLACFFRSRLPFWANPNGNKQPIQWGIAAPYPNINIITGAWIRDTRALLRARGGLEVVRPPVGADRYFLEGPYAGGWRRFLLPERLLALVTTWRVERRGAKANLFFTDARELRAGFRYDPEALPTIRARLASRLVKRWRRWIASAEIG